MKAFDTLSEQELVALTEDEIQRYIDYACAENGVALMPSELPAPPVTEFPEPDAIIHSIGSEWHFTTADEAARVLAALVGTRRVTLEYMSGPTGRYEQRIAEREQPARIEAKTVYSRELGMKIGPLMADAKRTQETYDKAKKDYDRAVSDRAEYADDIRGKVNDAWETHNRREARRSDYARYLSLADGNAEIAARFLANAHGDARALLPDLFVFPAAESFVTREQPAEAVAAGMEDDIAF